MLVNLQQPTEAGARHSHPKLRQLASKGRHCDLGNQCLVPITQGPTWGSRPSTRLHACSTCSSACPRRLLSPRCSLSPARRLESLHNRPGNSMLLTDTTASLQTEQTEGFRWALACCSKQSSDTHLRERP